jgi:Protein of unknown function (DUF3122)
MFQHIVDNLESAIALIITTLILFLIIFLLTIKPAIGSITEQEVAPGYISCRSERVLSDRTGNKWQVMFFTPVDVSPVTALNLRLSGLYSSLRIQSQKPLVITTLGDRFEATDLFLEKSPLPSIGQYDLQDILPHLSTEELLLEIPLENGQSARLPIPKAVVREWQAVAAKNADKSQKQSSGFQLAC